MTSELRLPGVNRASLTPFVRRVLEEDDAEVVDYSVTTLYGGWASSTTGGGVYRVSGRAAVSGPTLAWSVVLKIVPRPDSYSNDEVRQRELRAYESGALAELPGGFATPRYYGGGMGPDGTIHLWVEDLAGALAGARWSPDDYRVAARLLGAFNGAYLTGRPLPNGSWLSRSWLRSDWLDQLRPPVTRFLDEAARGTLTLPVPEDVIEGVRRLWSEHTTLLDALDRLPLTFCHLDAFSRNLFLRRGAECSDQLLAVDWAFTGTAALGEDLVPFVAASLVFEAGGTAPAMDELDRIAFDGYVVGLRDAGWSGDSRLARLGYTAASALRYGLHALWLYAPLDQMTLDAIEKTFYLPFEEFIAWMLPYRRFLLGHADEACGLVNALGLG